MKHSAQASDLSQVHKFDARKLIDQFESGTADHRERGGGGGVLSWQTATKNHLSTLHLAWALKRNSKPPDRWQEC